MNKKLLPLRIQLFADGDQPPTQEEIAAQLELELGNDPKETKVPSNEEAAKTPSNEEGSKVDKTPEEIEAERVAKELEEKNKGKTPEQIEAERIAKEKKSKEEEEDKKNPTKKLREEYERIKKDVKSYETKNQKLMKAIKLGIKGETEEEILNNLEQVELKEEADKSGLTESQIKKEKELEERMKKLNEDQQMVLFNNRAFNLKVNKNINDSQVGEFFKKCNELGINLLTNTVPFEKIFDSVMGNNNSSNKILTEKDNRIKELEEENLRLRQSSAPGSTPNGGSGKTQKDEMEILNNLLEQESAKYGK